MKEEEMKEVEGERLEEEMDASGESENFVSMKKPRDKEAYKVAIGEPCLQHTL